MEKTIILHDQFYDKVSKAKTMEYLVQDFEDLNIDLCS
jgi:hypothetical protein